MNPFTYALGPLVLAIFLNTYIAGLVGFQYAIYKSSRFKICWRARVMVVVLWIIDLFQTALTVYMAWIYCVTDFVNPTAIQQAALWTYSIMPICNSISSSIAYIFMGHRLYTIAAKTHPMTSSLIYATSIIIVFSLGFTAGVCGLLWDVSMIDAVTDAVGPYRPLLVSWLSARLGMDAILLGGLSCLFVYQGTAFMDHIPSRFVRGVLLAIQCGALTGAFSLLSLITFACSAHTTTYLVFLLPSGRLYSNIVLTTIGARARPEPLPTQTQVLTKDIWAANPSARCSNGTQAFNLTEMTRHGHEGGADLSVAVDCARGGIKSSGSVGTADDGPSTVNLDAKCECVLADEDSVPRKSDMPA